MHIASSWKPSSRTRKGRLTTNRAAGASTWSKDAGDPSRVWLYEVYDDEAAFQAHTEAPHFIKFRDATQDIRVEGIQGAARGSSNIWPTDGEWK